MEPQGDPAQGRDAGHDLSLDLAWLHGVGIRCVVGIALGDVGGALRLLDDLDNAVHNGLTIMRVGDDIPFGKIPLPIGDNDHIPYRDFRLHTAGGDGRGKKRQQPGKKGDKQYAWQPQP